MKRLANVFFVLAISFVSMMQWIPEPVQAKEKASKAPDVIPYAKREAVRAFAESLAEEEGFDVDALMSVLARGEYKQSIIDAISRPAEKVLTWNSYQDIFLKRKRIESGRKFLRKYEETLKRAEATHGVPAAIIVAIIGVETFYGDRPGDYRVLDALMTLGFDYPPRADFFLKELRQFLLMTREEGSDPLKLKGSYAGAMGFGQFIPSSFRHYAVDFDDDGIKDIWNNPVDAIGSVANYLGEHGWSLEERIVLRAFNVGNEAMEFFSDEYKPATAFGQLMDHGVRTRYEVTEAALVSPMRFEGKKGEEYWIGLNNFYVITRYNRSKLYAMAVFQLSKRITGEKMG